MTPDHKFYVHIFVRKSENFIKRKNQIHNLHTVNKLNGNEKLQLKMRILIKLFSQTKNSKKKFNKK